MGWVTWCRTARFCILIKWVRIVSKENPMENQSLKSEFAPNWAYRGQSFANLLRMGHCAPTVMQSILDISSMEKEWLVRLSAGMPGGIGNTGYECGGVTSPLVLLGIHDGLCQVDGDLPVIFDKGYALCQQFIACHKTLRCKEIRGKDRFPRHCIPPVLLSPEIFMNVLDGDHGQAIPAGEKGRQHPRENSLATGFLSGLRCSLPS